MTRKRVKIFLIIAILLAGLLAVFKFPLFNKNNKRAQYQLQNDGSVGLVLTETETGERGKITAAEKIGQSFGRNAVKLAETLLLNGQFLKILMLVIG